MVIVVGNYHGFLERATGVGGISENPRRMHSDSGQVRSEQTVGPCPRLCVSVECEHSGHEAGMPRASLSSPAEVEHPLARQRLID